MLRWTILACAAVAALLTGCGDDDGDASPAGGGSAEPTSREAPVYTPPTESGDYADPAALIKDLNAKGFACEPDISGPGFSAAGAQTYACWRPGNTEALRAQVYASREQQADDVAALKGNNWQVVEGNLYAVAAHTAETALAVQAALNK